MFYLQGSEIILLLCNHAVHLSWTTSPYDSYLKPPLPIFFLLLIYIFVSSWNFITFFMTLLTYIIIDVFPWFRNTQMFDHCCMFRKSRVVISFQKEMLWHRDVNHLLLHTLVTRTSFLINLIVVYTECVIPINSCRSACMFLGTWLPKFWKKFKLQYLSSCDFSSLY